MRLAVIALFGLAALFAAWRWYVAHPSLWPEYRRATALISEIERFRAAHGRVPNDARELRTQTESLEGPVFYQATGRDSYEVWFGRSLGASYTYDSATRDWH